MRYEMIRKVLLIVVSATGFLLVPALPSWACEEAHFSPSTYSAGESDGSVTLTVKNPFPREGPRTVEYATVTGTAKGGSDYVTESGILSFTGNETSKSFSITIIDDSAGEADERFYVKLKLTPGSCITAVGPAAMVTIHDADAAPQPTPTREEESTPPPQSPTGPSGPGPDAEPGAFAPPFSPDDRTPEPTPTATDGETQPERSPDERTVASASGPEGGGLSVLALAGIAFGVLLVGSTAIVYVKDRFLTTP
ncbi:MAG: Calx-beta domain-containing protein, partial [Actinomycetota bacterium]